MVVPLAQGEKYRPSVPFAYSESVEDESEEPDEEEANGNEQPNRVRRYPDERSELDVMWAAVQLVEAQFAEAGFAPR